MSKHLLSSLRDCKLSSITKLPAFSAGVACGPNSQNNFLPLLAKSDPKPHCLLHSTLCMSLSPFLTLCRAAHPEGGCSSLRRPPFRRGPSTLGFNGGVHRQSLVLSFSWVFLCSSRRLMVPPQVLVVLVPGIPVLH